MKTANPLCFKQLCGMLRVFVSPGLLFFPCYLSHLNNPPQLPIRGGAPCATDVVKPGMVPGLCS